MKIVPGTQTDVVRLTTNYSAKKTFGGVVAGNDILQGNSTTNPSQSYCYVIAVAPCDGVSTANVFIDVSIEYIALWSELRDVAAS